jgi:hypothetical protein
MNERLCKCVLRTFEETWCPFKKNVAPGLWINYPLVMSTVCYGIDDPVEIVDVPSYKMVDLSSSLWDSLPEGKMFANQRI